MSFPPEFDANREADFERFLYERYSNYLCKDIMEMTLKRNYDVEFIDLSGFAEKHGIDNAELYSIMVSRVIQSLNSRGFATKLAGNNTRLHVYPKNNEAAKAKMSSVV